MNKKVVYVLFLLILVFGGVYIAYLADNDFKPVSIDNIEKTSLSVSSEGPIGINDVIQEIISNDYYQGYDKETLYWMESRGNKYVFMSEEGIIVMNYADAQKIPSQYATDVSITENIKCKIIEKHSLGNIKYPKEVIYVYDVEYVDEDIKYFDV